MGMGNADSKLLEDNNVNNILNAKEKDKNDLIYAKMTRGQFQEFIKFLEYKKELLKKKAITNKPHNDKLRSKSDQIRDLNNRNNTKQVEYSKNIRVEQKNHRVDQKINRVEQRNNRNQKSSKPVKSCEGVQCNNNDNVSNNANIPYGTKH